MQPLRVGVAPGTTTIRLGDCNGALGMCIPPAFPIDTDPQPGAGMYVQGNTDPYANEIELRAAHARGHGVLGRPQDLGLVLVPFGYKRGQMPYEVVAVGAGPDRLGCDPQHYTKGEEGYYYDSSLGEDQSSQLYASAPASSTRHAVAGRRKPSLGRGDPTDAEVATGLDYRPVVTQMAPTPDGRLIPLPWVPPNGWNPGGAFGPRAWPHPIFEDPRWRRFAKQLRDAADGSPTDPTSIDSTAADTSTTAPSSSATTTTDQATIVAAQNAANEQQHRKRMFTLGVISTASSVAIAASIVASRLLRRRRG